MRVVGLVSGGKDSCYNMMQCVAAGHTIVALANIQPSGKDELDSYMYQTVGHQGISIIAEAMGLPLFRRITKGHALEKGKMYQKTENDEVEDLYELLKLVKKETQVEGVAVGAILSDYQRVRVENVCNRLGLVSLAYLWRRDQTELLQEMIDCQVNAIVIKVAALGLEPSALGRPLRALQPQLLRARDKFGLNVCGEGGEYETFTLDCPLFKKRIVVDETQVVIHSNDPIAPAGYMNLLKLHLVPKSETENSQGVIPTAVKTSLDYISDLNESCYSDLSDIELSEGEMEIAEDITQARRQSMSESTALNPLLDCRTEDKGNSASTFSCPSVLIVENSNNASEESTPATQNSLSLSDDKKISLNQLTKNFQKLDGLTIDGKNGSEKPENQRFHRKRTNSRNHMSNPPSPIKYECEKTPIEDTGCIFANNSGWHWIGGIVGEGSDSKSAMENAVTKLCSHLESRNLTLSDVCSVTLYVRSMEDYADFNEVYVKVLSIPDPPARVCVQCPLPDDIGVIMEAVVHKWPNKEALELDEIYRRDRHTMHVQGISHWAPANIGPYSQAVRVGDIIYLAGQIPLVPGSMTLADSDNRAQCRLALRHVQRLLNAMDAKTQIRDVVQAVCYLTHPLLIGEARRQWERRTNNAIVDYVVVPRLPRDAALEWHVWAHRHNSRFEYEETGCHVGEYKVAIRRRWNYENNVAAVVCYVATGSSPSTSQLSFQSEESFLAHKILASQISQAEIVHILEYCTKKLLRDYRNEATVGLRIFYKVAISPDVSVLIDALRKFRNDKLPNLAFTVIPVIHLQNAFTFLSISAIRHESD